MAQGPTGLIFHIWNSQGNNNYVAQGHPLFHIDGVLPIARGHVQIPDRAWNNPPRPNDSSDYGYTAEAATAGIGPMLANWVEFYDYCFQSIYNRQYQGYSTLLQGFGQKNTSDYTRDPAYGIPLTQSYADRVASTDVTSGVSTPFSATGISINTAFTTEILTDFKTELTARGLSFPEYFHMDQEYGNWDIGAALTSGASGPGWLIPTLNDPRVNTEFITGSETFQTLWNNKRTIGGSSFSYDPLQRVYKSANHNLLAWLWNTHIDSCDYAMDIAFYQPAKVVFENAQCSNYAFYAANPTYFERNKLYNKRYGPLNIRSEFHSPVFYPLRNEYIDTSFSKYSDYLTIYGILDEGLTAQHLRDLNIAYLNEMIDHVFATPGITASRVVPWLIPPGNVFHYDAISNYENDPNANFTITREDVLDMVVRSIDQGCRQFIMWSWDNMAEVHFDDMAWVAQNANDYYYTKNNDDTLTGPTGSYDDPYEGYDDWLDGGTSVSGGNDPDGEGEYDNYGVFIRKVSPFNKKRMFSQSVEESLPQYFREAYPTLVEFLEAYYEFLEEYEDKIGNPLDLQSITDIDKTFDDFTAFFKKEFLHNFPEQLAIDPLTGLEVNEKTLLKQIKQFYSAKGTEKSFDLLFRIVYDTNLEFYYPKVDILRLSDGKWVKTNAIKLSSTRKNELLEVVGNKILQRNATFAVIASGTIQNVTSYQQGGYEVTEVALQSINGSFVADRPVEFSNIDGIIVEERKIYSVVSGITINQPGSGYAIGDQLVFTNAAGDAGYGAAAEVSKIDTTGAIQKIKITNFGANYKIAPTITFTSENGESGTATAVVGALCSYPGYYANSDGIIDSRKRIQDNHYYQDYSYVLKTEITIDRYRQLVKDLLHPAGFGFFGQILIKRCLEVLWRKQTIADTYELPRIGNYLPYLFSTHDDLPYWFLSTTGHPGATGYDPYVHDPLLGPSGQDYYWNGWLVGNPVSAGVTFESGHTALMFTGWDSGDPFWITYHHPNTKGLIEIPGPSGYATYDADSPYGATFSQITIYDFLHMPLGYHYDSCQSDLNSFPPPHAGGSTANDDVGGDGGGSIPVYPQSKHILYHIIDCSTNAILQNWEDSGGAAGAPRGWTASIWANRNFLDIMNRYEQYRNEAAIYGVDLGLILVHPFGYGPWATIPGSDTQNGIDTATRHRLDETYRAASENGGSYTDIVTAFMNVFKDGASGYPQDTIMYVGSYPKEFWDDSRNGMNINMLRFLTNNTGVGAAFNGMSNHKEDSPLYQSISIMNTDRSNRWWSEPNPFVNSPMAGRNDVRYLSTKTLWDTASQTGRVSRNEAPLASINWISSDESINPQGDALQCLALGGLTMSTAVDLNRIASSFSRNIVYAIAKIQQDARRALYAYE